jgi:formylglycine-generating enzyme required for sulfatase activity
MLSHPNSGVRRTAIQELIGLLEGRHLGLARAAQEKLQEIAENDDSLSLRKSASDTLIAHGLISESPISISVESPKKEPTAEKRIEKPVRVSALPTHTAEPSQKEQNVSVGVAPRAFPDLKGIPSKLNLRFLGLLVGAVLAIIAVVLLVKSNFFAPKLGIGSTMVSEKDGMTRLYIPAGEFTMGSEDGGDDEKPVHTVYLDAFWIDKTEVTNAMYANCVNDRNCKEPSNTAYYADSNYAIHPVVYVSWEDAVNYCSWANRRLPTEAEWEKAASWNGPAQEKYTYPWGNDFSCENGNFNDETLRDSYVVPGGANCDGFPQTSPVGNFPNGVSPYGALDMAGNVWEWLADWYDTNYYATVGENARNPQGPTSGQYRVLRGGAWIYDNDDARSANRDGFDPSSFNDDFGFRCAMSATP